MWSFSTAASRRGQNKDLYGSYSHLTFKSEQFNFQPRQLRTYLIFGFQQSELFISGETIQSSVSHTGFTSILDNLTHFLYVVWWSPYNKPPAPSSSILLYQMLSTISLLECLFPQQVCKFWAKSTESYLSFNKCEFLEHGVLPDFLIRIMDFICFILSDFIRSISYPCIGSPCLVPRV